jgi:uroporphyrinogen-III synthase
MRTQTNRHFVTPLGTIRVVVTRAERQADGLAQALQAAGAEVAPLPLLAVGPPDDLGSLERAASEVALYDWIVFASANAVEAFLPLAGGSLPARLRIAVVGPATAAALRPFRLVPHLTATRSEAEGLVADLRPHLRPACRILVPQAADARKVLAEGLTAAGAEVVAVVAYDKRLPESSSARAAELFAHSPIGWVTFTSPRIVRHFVDLFGEAWPRRRPELLAASIGPVTSAALRRLGVEPAAEAAQPGDEGMVQAILAALAK